MTDKKLEPQPSSTDTSTDRIVIREVEDQGIDLSHGTRRWVEKSIPMVSATAPEPAPPGPPDAPPPGGGADEGTNQE